MPSFGEGEKLLVTGSTHDAYGFRKTDDPRAHGALVERINEKVLKSRASIVETEGYFLEDCEVCAIAYGFTARTSLYVVKQLRQEGLKAGLLRIKTLWPFPVETVAEVGKRARKVLVPEMNRGQVAGEVKKFCPCEVIPLGQSNGEIIRPERIREAMRRI